MAVTHDLRGQYVSIYVPVLSLFLKNMAFFHRTAELDQPKLLLSCLYMPKQILNAMLCCSWL